MTIIFAEHTPEPRSDAADIAVDAMAAALNDRCVDLDDADACAFALIGRNFPARTIGDRLDDAIGRARTLRGRR